MPEGDYAFKPTPQVRSFGQLVGHLINDHYLMCSAAKGEKSPSAADFEKVTAEAELVKALGDSIAYCDAVCSSMTDASALQPVEAFGQKVTRFGILQLNVTHDSEHYGNMVTYMRLKGLVPPSSASSQ
ncbi:MAG: DinB family protein [Acidobacteria bacterium]|nr:DinB family protein [Acidobacteriota bacterium]